MVSEAVTSPLPPEHSNLATRRVVTLGNSLQRNPHVTHSCFHQKLSPQCQQQAPDSDFRQNNTTQENQSEDRIIDKSKA